MNELLPTPTRRAPPRRRRRRRRSHPLRAILLLLILLAAVGVLLHAAGLGQVRTLARIQAPDWVDVQIIDINGSARRGETLSRVNDIAIHYVGNPGTTAQQNHDFFAQPDTAVSAHFLVGLEGEVIQCIPLNEKSSATNDRNRDTISIEVCHPDETGRFTKASYDALVRLTAWLCDTCDIGRDHVIRHYDVTGKLCPLYFVEHPDAWAQFLRDVAAAQLCNSSLPSSRSL